MRYEVDEIIKETLPSKWQICSIDRRFDPRKGQYVGYEIWIVRGTHKRRGVGRTIGVALKRAIETVKS